MSWSRYLLVTSLALLQPWAASAQQAGWQLGQVNATMCQWAEPRAAVIRDTVYIDGGYLWWEPGMANGQYNPPVNDGNPLGLVYLLNFSMPFNMSSNMSQVFTTISKAPNGGAANNFGPLYYDGGMLANDDEFFTYGGMVAPTDAFAPPAADAVLAYEAFWYGAAGKQFIPGFLQDTLPSGVTRWVTSGAAVSVPSENLGFYFSGLRSASSGEIDFTTANETVNADVVSNTLISLDMSVQQSEKWANLTLPASVPGRANPEIVWVPVSKRGVLVALGGSIDPEFAYASQSLNTSQMTQDQAVDPGLMTTVSVYDVATGSWYNQATSGQAPGALTQGCTVVASAQDGSSHNIYWYGGFDGIDSTQPFSDSVWVLSVPAFKWTKVYNGTTTNGRAGHKCVKPYPDQMFVIGGYPTQSGDALPCVPTSFVLVFNLSSASWMTSYDPAVWSNYSVPSSVSAAIGGNSAGGSTLTPSSWSNHSLATLFSTAYDSTKIKNWYPYASQVVNTTNPRQTIPPVVTATSSSGLPSWVAPVLGVVLGLVALSAILVCIILWRRRRFLSRRTESEAGTSEVNRYRIMSWVRGADPKSPTVTSDETPSSQFGDVEPPPEPVILPPEAGSTQVFEMPDSSKPQELSDTGMRYLPVAVTNLRGTGLKPSHSQNSHASHASQSSFYSDFSKDSLSTGPTVSPALSAATPHGADSPPVGVSGSPRAGFVSGISATSSDYRDLVQSIEQSHGDEGLAEKSETGPDVSSPLASSPEASSPSGLGIASPVSPPTPQSREGDDYIMSQMSRASRQAGPTGGSVSGSGSRKSNFGEMLDGE